jgi:predicted RNA-binding protein associated with RNAse of E/G family
LGDSLWTDNATLWLARPEDEYCILLFWRASDWRFLGWYINLQASLKRTSVGFESEDHILDILVHPDLTWEWKDEDEFAAAQRVGRFTAAQAETVRAAGLTAIAQVNAHSWPYSDGWEQWRPDPSWRIPPLPSNWHDD